MSSERYITKEKKAELEKELSSLRGEIRPQIIERVAAARELGDLKENSEYHSARDEQAKIESRIEEIEFILKTAKIFKKNADGIVKLGSTIVVIDTANKKEKTFEIVGEEESDSSLGKISHTSPIGGSLVGKKEGDRVTIITPGGKIEYKIKKLI